MAYLLENQTSDINSDIIRRKEFYQYYMHDRQFSPGKTIVPRFMIDKMISDGNFLQFHSYQLFVANYVNPNTPYSRLLMKWQTGTGKTIGSLAIAMNFIKYFRDEEIRGGDAIGSVFVLGFTSSIFRNELMRFPEFGIITRTELAKLNKLRKAAYNGTKFDLEKYHEFLMRTKRKFNNRKNNGFFRFYGYKKLVNMIFNITDKTLIISTLDENGIDDAIKDGRIKLNTPLLDEFKNSLLLCDEIHNVYNSLDKNNWGVALQYILNHHPSIRAVFMSATPINNSPTEVVDLLNILLPRKCYPKLIKSEFFDKNKKLKRGALDRLANLCKGRISYIRDSNPLYFPSKKFIGEHIPNAPYLRFIRCPMSPFHYATYDAVYKGALSPESQYLTDFAIPNPNDKIGLYQTSEIKKVLPYAPQAWKDANKIDFQKNLIVGDILQLTNLSRISNKYVQMMTAINDIIKNQKGKIFIYHNVIHMSGVLFIQEILLQNFVIGEFDSSTGNTLCVVCGRHRKDHIANEINVDGGADALALDELVYVKYKGNPIHVDYNNTLKKYTVAESQYAAPYMEFRAIENVIVCDFVRDGDACNTIKALGRHNKVLVVMKTKSCAKKLGFKVFYQTNDGKCVYYANFERENPAAFVRLVTASSDKPVVGGATHHFMPVRFIAVHSNIDKVSIDNSLSKFNAPDNSNGHRILILVGGKLVKEAVDIKAVRELMIMSRPDNIPTLIQIMGRAVRKNSHKYLPEDQRTVNIRIFTSCLPNKVKINGQMVYALGYEEIKYVEKLNQYKIIQNIEKTMHEHAIDAYINRDIIWADPKDSTKPPEIGALYYKPATSMTSFRASELNLKTFNAFHVSDEIDNVMIIIKRLFVERSPVWTYADLWMAVRRAHKFIKVEFNTSLVEENSFIVALSRLVWANDKQYVEPTVNDYTMQLSHGINSVIEKIFTTDDKIILLPGNQKSVITQVGDHYILFPWDSSTEEPMCIVELPYRVITMRSASEINIRSFLESGSSLVKYENKRERFFTKWNSVLIEDLEPAVCDFGTDFHIAFLEDCITYIFNVWVDPTIKKSPMHAFFFKMLNYYDLRRLVIWGHTIKPYIFKKYTKYLNPVSEELKQIKTKKIEAKAAEMQMKDPKMSTSGIINLLKSSLNKSNLDWVSSGLKKQFDDNLSRSLKLFDGNYKRPTHGPAKKINADVVPVGHYLNDIPKFYHPDEGWFESPEYMVADETFVENGVVVGYDERSKTGVHIRFKIRSPIQNIKQYKDSRLIEKGSVCLSKSKAYLRDIATKIGIKKVTKKTNVVKLCSDIRTKLIYLELKERLAGTKKKWFYFIYERRPETTVE
jgi:hypothetical protein